MKLTGRVSLEELDAYAHYMGFDSWYNYRITLSDYERKLVFNTIYEERSNLMSISEPETPLGVIITK